MRAIRPHPSLQGAIAPLFTPFHEDGHLDEEGLRNLVRHLVKGGQVTSVFLRSGLGQMWQYTRADFESALIAAVEGAEGHVALLAGTSGFWSGDLSDRPDPAEYLRQSQGLAEAAAALGAHGIVVVVPYMLAAEGPFAGVETPGDLTKAYLREVSRVTSLPVLLYQAPAVPSEFWVTAALLRELLEEVPNLVGMKVSNRRLEVFEPLAEAARGTGFALICGNEFIYLPCLDLGCSGVIGEGCNTYPALLAALRERHERRDMAGARRAQEAVIRCLEAVSGLDAAIIGKQLLQRQGVPLQPYGRERPRPYSAEAVERAVLAQIAAHEYADVPSPYG